MKVLIVNWAGLNTGDDIILETCVQFLHAHFDSVEIGVMGHHIGTEIAERLSCRVFGSVFEVEVRPNGWKDLIAAVRWADAVIVGGGDILRERVASFAPFALAAALGRPVCGIGIGVTDRSRSRFWAAGYYLLVKSISSLYVRDEGSREKLQPFFERDCNRLLIAPDVAFASITSPSVEERCEISAPSSRRVCINLRQLHDTDYLGTINVTNAELVDTITNVLALASSDGSLEIILIPMVDDSAISVTRNRLDSDLSILQELAVELEQRGFGVRVQIERPNGLRELESILRDAAIVIGERYHFLIGALSTNATILCVPYAPKVKQLMMAIPGMQLLSQNSSTVIQNSDWDIRAHRVADLHAQAVSAIRKSLIALSNPVRYPARVSGACLVFLLMSEPITKIFRVTLGRFFHSAISSE